MVNFFGFKTPQEKAFDEAARLAREIQEGCTDFYEKNVELRNLHSEHFQKSFQDLFIHAKQIEDEEGVANKKQFQLAMDRILDCIHHYSLLRLQINTIKKYRSDLEKLTAWPIIIKERSKNESAEDRQFMINFFERMNTIAEDSEGDEDERAERLYEEAASMIFSLSEGAEIAETRKIYTK